MRIIALTTGDSPVLSMANGGAETTQTIPQNTYVTLTGRKADGGNVYYSMEEYTGYIKKDNVKLLRDEEFYYSSSLLSSKANRSATSFYSMARSLVPLSPEVKSVVSGSVSTTPKSTTSGSGSTSSSTSLIPSPSAASTNAAANGATPVKKNLFGEIAKTMNIPTDPKAYKINNTYLGAGVAAGFLGKTSIGQTPLGAIGSSMILSYGSTGSWDKANNMNIGAAFGTGIAGQLMAGATINNISNGSFFTDGLITNAANLVAKKLSNALSTLLQKLDYVVGFNLSGILLNSFTNFRISKNGNGIFTFENIYRRKDKYYYSNLEEQINHYFRYRGANYAMITKSANGRRWTQDAYYSTPTFLSSKVPSEVKVHQNLYETLYSEFSDNMTSLRSNLNLDISRDEWFYKFNRYRLIQTDSILGNTKGYIFFTRPDINISNDLNSSIFKTDIGLLFFNMASQHPGIMKSLTSSLSEDHKFIPVLSNRCTGLEIQDEELEVRELNDTLTGWKLNYGTNLIKSKTAGTVTTSFIDDQQLSIYLMMKLWCEYISAVSRGVTSPKSDYIKKKQLDYAISIYYFLTAEDGESIVFWTKFTGCFPTKIPSSNFSDSWESPVRIPKYSISWQYTFKKDYDPFSLAEFNNLTGKDFKYMNMYNASTGRSPRTIQGSPFVDTNTGGKLFKLRFRQA